MPYLVFEPSLLPEEPLQDSAQGWEKSSSTFKVQPFQQGQEKATRSRRTSSKLLPRVSGCMRKRMAVPRKVMAV